MFTGAYLTIYIKILVNMCYNCACYASNGHPPSLAVRQAICLHPTKIYTGVIGGVTYTFPPLPAALLAPRAGHRAAPPAVHRAPPPAVHHAGHLVVHHAGHPVVPHAGHLVVPHAGHLVVHPVVDMSTCTDPQGVVRFCKGNWRKSLCFHGKKCNRVCGRDHPGPANPRHCPYGLHCKYPTCNKVHPPHWQFA